MRSILIYFFTCAACLFTIELSAQSSKLDTITLQVNGVCEMCKERIETASYDVPGVKHVNWDLESEILTAIIVPKKASKQKIAEAVAKAGYTNELVKADSNAYAELPKCCQYESVQKHNNR